jgi:hypothetical protein
MTGEDPVVPVVDQMRIAALGLEMVHLSLAVLFAVSAELEERILQWLSECVPVLVAWPSTSPIVVEVDPTRSVTQTDGFEPLRLARALHEVHRRT